MRCMVLLGMLGTLSIVDVEAATVIVNCTKGETIGAALARLDKHGPNTVHVRGTCVEQVDIRHFERLTLQGRGAAAIAAPPGVSGGTLVVHNSREVLVSDLSVIGRPSADLADCRDCQIHGSTMDGPVSVEASRALFLRDVLRANGSFAAVAIYDSSVANIVNCSVEPGSGTAGWGVLSANASWVQVGGTEILGFPVGIQVSHAQLGIANLSTPFANYSGHPAGDSDQTVVIESSSPSGWSIDAQGGSSVSVGGVARLGRDGTAGGGIRVNAHSTVSIQAGAEIAGSYGVGVMATNGSHVEVGSGARIVGTLGNGLVVVNNSTALAGGPAEISGSSAQDIFCDATSVLSGVSRMTAPKMTCPNQNPGQTVPLPTQ